MLPKCSLSLAIVAGLLIATVSLIRADNDPFAAPMAPAIAAVGNLPAPTRLPGDVSPIETHVLGRNNMLWKAPSSVRVIVTDHRTGRPLRANVSIWIDEAGNAPDRGHKEMYSGRTDKFGTLDASFKTNTAQPGPHVLLVSVDSRLGVDTFSQPLQLDQTAQILLTCDKPIYQPGQVVHMRALVRDGGSGEALSGQPITFEVEDGRGNKVDKDTETLSEFGVASTDFQLADEVNMGAFTLRAITASDQVEKTVQVSRYVLPKFKVTVKTDKPYYLPGEVVTGSLKAMYIFGKPLAGASAHVALNTVDIGVSNLARIDSATDDTGSYRFSFQLPAMLVGQPLEQGKAQVEVAADITDTAGQEQQANVRVPVVSSPVVVAVVPESRQLVPGVENRVYIAAATPDGQPLPNIRVDATVDGKDDSGALLTDPLGLQTFSFTPKGTSVTVHVEAADGQGHTGTADVTLNASPSSEGLILRSDRTLAKVGDKLRLQAVCSVTKGTLYVDVIRDKQTIATRAVDIQDGVASLSVSLSPDMAGTIEIHAYTILPGEDIIRDTRTVIVSPADSLNVAISPNQPMYKPGEDATIDFRVSDQGGNPVSTALGVAIVDESVFALSELQPGLEKIYFTLEKELMEPKYQINGLSPVGLIDLPPAANGPVLFARQRAAAMLLAGAPASTEYDYDTSTFNAKYIAFIKSTIEPEMLSSYGLILDALDRYIKDNGSPLAVNSSLFALVKDGYLNIDALKDHWGNFYRTDGVGSLNYNGTYFTLNSAGLDGKWHDADDIVGFRAYKPNGPTSKVAMMPGVATIEQAGANGIQLGGPWGSLGGFGRGGFVAAAGHVEHMNDAIVAGAVVEDMAAPAPMMAPPLAPQPMNALSAFKAIGVAAQAGGPVAAAEPPRLRQYFPETMYWNPALITDDNGLAQVNIPMADSITTWRVSTMANSASGLLGSGDLAPIKVFQDFFVDMDLPVAMTQDDQVDLPVVVYNYLPRAQDVTVTLTNDTWFVLSGPASQTVHMAANDVRSVSFPITVKGIGHHTLTVTAIGSTLSDAVRRPIDVLPDGKEFDTVVNDQMSGGDVKSVIIPANAIPGASQLFVKVFPGAFSQVVDGLDGMLRMPSGCFEQTSSSTFPDILVLDYLKQTHKVNPELQMKADQYINVGYQRLVTFECKNGGFSWFGNEPAHQVLTAYGLIEFADMAKVHEVDPAILLRTENWLASRQQPDGSWNETGQGIAEGIINRQTGRLRTTAYVGWALAEAGYAGPQLATALSYVTQHWTEQKDPYTLAVLLNFLDTAAPSGQTASDVAQALMTSAKVTDKTALWQSDTQTFTGATASGADLETTGLAAYGLARYGREPLFTTKVLTRLVQSKDSFGAWETTQGTVWSLKALLYAGQHSTGGESGTVTLTANGQPLKSFTISSEDSDVMRQVDGTGLLKGEENDLTLAYQGQGAPLYSIVGRYFMPWTDVPKADATTEPISLKVAYDKTLLQTNDTANVTVTIRNTTDETAQMPLIDLGVPPGFNVDTTNLETARIAGTIDKYTVAARQIIIYIQQLAPGATTTLTYSIHAKYPVTALTPPSKVYPYYNPERVAVSPPQKIEAL